MTDAAVNDVITRLTSALADRYRMDREIGTGGMASVYLAHDIRHDRDVAIKVLHPDLAAALGASRFLAEIRTTARLQHPHILPLLDSGEADGLLYYVMPFVTGETLRIRLEREHQLPLDDALRIANEVADSLSHAHGFGVIHRDIKPENILLQGGHALVADFGIALAVQSAGGQRMTQTGLSLGTPQYMSPEQAMGERAIDARSDIYSLGAVTYEMLVGEPPFTGPTVQAIVARLLTEDPREITAQRKAIPEHVEAAVLRALEKIPADRFATAADFCAALRDSSIQTTRTRTSRHSAAPPLTVRNLSRAPLIASALALLAAGSVGGWAASRVWQPGSANNNSLTVTSILAPPGGAFGEQRSLALSPDGQRLAFVFAASDGSRMLWLRRLDRLDPEAVPRTTGANAPFWSPDGRSLGYFADGFLTIRDENGEMRKLCPVATPTGGSWNEKGVILFGHADGLSTVSVAGGSCQLIVPRGNGPLLCGVFLPGGERFLYSRGRGFDMLAAALDGKTLATLPVRANEFAVVAPGYLLFQSSTDIRSLDAQRFDVASMSLEGPVVRVASEVRSQGGVQTFAVASSGAFAFLPASIDRPYLEYDANGILRDTVRIDGTWTLAIRPLRAGPPLVAVGGNSVGIWLYDLDTDRSTRLRVGDPAFPTTGFGAGTTYPVFSFDGRRLVYAVSGPGRCRIVERDIGSDVDRIVLDVVDSSSTCPVPLDWSSDGKHLLVRRDTSLQVVGIDGKLAPRQIVRPGRLWEGRFAPDGR